MRTEAPDGSEAEAVLVHGVESLAPQTGRSAGEVLVASHLGKRFGDRVAVHDVSFGVAAGETYGLLGPNGAGKTTTIRLVCGLLRPDSGEIRIAGRRVGTTATQAKRYVGYVPQDIALYPDLTARENLRFFGPSLRPARQGAEPSGRQGPGPRRPVRAES